MVNLVYAFRALDRSVIVVQVLAPYVATHGTIAIEFCVTGWTMFCHHSIIPLLGLQNAYLSVQGYCCGRFPSVSLVRRPLVVEGQFLIRLDTDDVKTWFGQ